MSNFFASNSTRPSVIQYGFRKATPLKRPIRVDHHWLHRPYFSIRLSSQNSNAFDLFGVRESNYSIVFNLQNVHFNQLLAVFEKILREIVAIGANNVLAPIGRTHARLVLESEKLNKAVNFRALDIDNPEETIQQLLDEVEKVLQSNEDLFFDEGLKVSFLTYERKKH
jgi:hypothetical protein